MKIQKKTDHFWSALQAVSLERRAMSQQHQICSLTAHCSLLTVRRYFAAATLLTVMVSPSAVPVTLAFSPASLSSSASSFLLSVFKV